MTLTLAARGAGGAGMTEEIKATYRAHTTTREIKATHMAQTTNTVRYSYTV